MLDEIGEMPLEAQVRLLRVIQHREIERVGGADRIPVDIRIIAATNQDLAALVRSGRFREDLYFRLNVFPIAVPPLRDRISDIPALVQHLIDRKAKELKLGDAPRLADGAIDDLLAYDWPGNVRELENVVERAMILHRGEPLRFDDLRTSFSSQTSDISSTADGETLELDAIVARHIRRVLGMTGGKIHGAGGAGELLGVNPNTLRYKMRKLGIPFRKQQLAE
jgi:transcriptional regulator with GAF, ATPase, and Fis domain